MRKFFTFSFFKKNDNFKFPQLQSHRGYCLDETQENTLTAVKNAYDFKYSMVEFDVQMTSDFQIILFHDSFYKVGRRKKVIARTSFSQVYQDKHVSTLEDVFNWYKKNKIQDFILNIEIKSKNLIKFRLEEEVLQLIRKHKMERNVIISSFNPFTLAYFHAKEPLIFRSMLLTLERRLQNNIFVKKGVFNFAAQPNALHLRYQDWDAQKWKHLTDNEIPIVLWTCNDVKKAKHFLSQGVVSIITDKILPTEME